MLQRLILKIIGKAQPKIDPEIVCEIAKAVRVIPIALVGKVLHHKEEIKCPIIRLGHKVNEQVARGRVFKVKIGIVLLEDGIFVFCRLAYGAYRHCAGEIKRLKRVVHFQSKLYPFETA